MEVDAGAYEASYELKNPRIAGLFLLEPGGAEELLADAATAGRLGVAVGHISDHSGGSIVKAKLPRRIKEVARVIPFPGKELANSRDRAVFCAALSDAILHDHLHPPALGSAQMMKESPVFHWAAPQMKERKLNTL